MRRKTCLTYFQFLLILIFQNILVARAIKASIDANYLTIATQGHRSSTTVHYYNIFQAASRCGQGGTTPSLGGSNNSVRASNNRPRLLLLLLMSMQ